MSYRDEREVLRERLAEAEARARRAEDELARTRAGAATLTALSGDVGFNLLKVALVLQVVAWGVLVIASVPTYISIAHDDPPFGGSLSPALQGCVMALVVDAFFAPAGLLPLAALIGIRRGRRWAWACMLASGAAGTLCMCVPLGAITLAVALRPRVRDAFHGAPT